MHNETLRKTFPIDFYTEATSVVSKTSRFLELKLILSENDLKLLLKQNNVNFFSVYFRKSESNFLHILGEESN